VSTTRPRARRIRRHPRFQREFADIRRKDPRADDALAGLETVLARVPEEAGMAVPGEPGWRQRPIHTGERSYSVVYTFDDREVLLLTVRRVPSGVFE
jgi:hypothetical protein